MIVGIGFDIVEHNLTEGLNWGSNHSPLSRIFSFKELAIYSIKKELNFLSGRFAAKEAILKCLGTGMQDGLALPEIQILQSESGKPIIELSGGVALISDKLEINLWHISISHSSKYSIAFAIAEKVSTS